MEFICPFVIFGLGCLMVLIGLITSAAARSRKARRRGRIVWISGAVILVLIAFGGYRVYVDEGLVQAVQRGSAKDVKAMLSIGASPNATIEHSPPAIEYAKRNHRDAIVKILREAGAKEYSAQTHYTAMVLPMLLASLLLLLYYLKVISVSAADI